MQKRNIRWHKIADSRTQVDWQANQMAAVEVAGKKFTIANKNGTLLACSYLCPHASGIMTDGIIDVAGNIVCPRHAYRFSLVNGRNTSGEGYHLKTYVIDESEAGIFICLEEPDALNI